MTCNRFLSSLLLACLISAPAMAQGGMEDFLLNSSGGQRIFVVILIGRKIDV